MDKVIFILCATTAGLCAFFLLRGYRRNGARLLLWSGVCFILLSVSNLLIMIDRMAGPNLDLSTTRLLIAFVGLALLVYGLIWESD